MRKILFASVAATALMVCSGPALADAFLSSGNVDLGVKSDGALGVSQSLMTAPYSNQYSSGGAAPRFSGESVGLGLLGVGDAIAPGCFCEGWGASGNGVAAYDGNADGSNGALGVISFTQSDASHATSVTSVGGTPLVVTQAYGPAAGAPSQIFQDTVTITNTDPVNTVTDVRYNREMDWDIVPTPYDEYTSIGGLPSPELIYSGDNGFCAPNPLTVIPGGSCASFFPGTTNTNFYHSGPHDQGSGFTFGFGDLAAGQSATFNIYYGADYSENAALNDLAAVGAQVYVLGESDPANNGTGQFGTPGTFVFGFGGAGISGGGVSVPEPVTLALLGSGLLGLGSLRRRYRKA